MTLLSIREQEAVKEAREFVVELIHPVHGTGIIGSRLSAYDRALILATRDAIARQVREMGEQDEREGFGPYSNARSVATFIEGLDV